MSREDTDTPTIPKVRCPNCCAGKPFKAELRPGTTDFWRCPVCDGWGWIAPEMVPKSGQTAPHPIYHIHSEFVDARVDYLACWHDRAVFLTKAMSNALQVPTTLSYDGVDMVYYPDPR